MTVSIFAILGISVFFITSNAADVLSTRRFLRYGGREGNPIIRGLMALIGVNGAFAIKMISSVAIAVYASIDQSVLPVIGGVGAWFWTISYQNYRYGNKLRARPRWRHYIR